MREFQQLTLSRLDARQVWLLFVLGALFPSGNMLANTGPVQSGLTATAENAFTAKTNPAGLTRIESTDWLGQLALFYSESTFEKSPDQSSGSVNTESDSILVAPFVYYARPINEKWSLGASFTALGFGEDVGGEGPGRYLVDEWAMAILSLAPAVGFRVNEDLSIGAAININYTYYSFESAIFNGAGNDDGRLEIEADDIGLAPQLGLLYEFSPNTRVGVNWTSENDPTLSDTPEISGGGNINVEEVEISSTTPQSLNAGIWHRFQGGSVITFDAAWVEFSKFGVSQVSVDGSEIVTQEQDFEDVWLFTAGYWRPVSEKWTVKAGVMYSTQFIEDANRTQHFKMDRILGIGLGGEYRWGSNKVIGLNLNFYDLGDAPVQVDIPGFGSFTGKYTKHQSVGLDFTFRWSRQAL